MAEIAGEQLPLRFVESCAGAVVPHQGHAGRRSIGVLATGASRRVKRNLQLIGGNYQAGGHLQIAGGIGAVGRHGYRASAVEIAAATAGGSLSSRAAM